MKKFFIIFNLTFLIVATLTAQVNDMIFSVDNTTFSEITGGTLLGSETIDDQRFVDPSVPAGGTTTTGVGLPIGFNFVFNGQVFDRFAVNTNGWISLGSSSLSPAVDINSSTPYIPIISTSTHNPPYLRSRIAAFARDLQGQTGSSLRYETIGTAPNRVLVVQWKNFRKYNATGDSYNFQIRLYETTNIVEIVYGPITNNTTATTVQVGLGGSTPSDFNIRTTTDNWLATTAGTTNNAACSLSNTVFPPSGTVFRWTPSTCPSPVQFTASNITSSSVNLSWTSSASEFQLEYGTQGFILGTGTRIENITSTSYTLTGLQPATNYQVYVRTVCAPGDTSTWTSISFTTPCASISAFPWTENFSSSTFPPNCWMRAKGQLTANTTFTSTTTSNWVADGFANVGTTGAARINIYGTNRYEWLITPQIDLGNGSVNYRLEFDLALTAFASTNPPGQSGTDDKFAVVISTDGGTTWSTANILRLWDNQGSPNVYNNISNTGQKIIINLTGYTGIVRIGFYGESTVSNADNDLFIDNVTIKELTSCPDPYNLLVGSITANSASISWTAGGSETLWNIEYGPLGFTQGTGTVINGVTNPYTITGLNPSTSYTVYVQADCGGGDLSPWSVPTHFTTSQIPATVPYFIDFETGTEQLTIVNGNFTNKWHHGSATAFSGTKSIYISNDNGISNAYTINAASTVHFYRDVTIPNVSNPILLEFMWKNFGEANNNYDYIKVYSITTNQMPVAGTQLTTTLLGGPYNQQSTWQMASIQIPDSLKGHTRRFVFSWYNDGLIGTQPPAAIDDIRIYVLTCPKPTNLSATNITLNSATLTWTAGGSETQWQVQWGPGGFALGTGTTVNVTSTTYNLSGLNASSNYSFYVRGICGVGDTSVWAGPFNFATQCGPVTAVYTQNFDGVTPPNLPNCWTSIVQGSSGSPNVQTTTTTFTSSPNSVQLFNATSSGSATHILLISPQFSDLPTKTTQITFKARFAGTGTGVLHVGTITDPTNPATFSVYQTIMTLSSQWQEYTVAFNNYLGSNQYIAFKHGLGMTNQTIYIDDVIYEPIPSCPKPSTLMVTNITGTTADVSWVAGGTETSWDLVYGPQGFNPSSQGTLIENINSTSYQLTGLNPSTSYQVYVLAQCSGTDSSSWTGPANFMTTQIPATLPYSWDFENDFQGWTVVNGTQVNKWHTGTAVFASPTKSAYISNTNGTTNNYDGTVSSVTHIYRDIQFPAGTEFVMTFKWKCVGESTYDYMRMFLENTTFEPVPGTLPSSTYIGRQYYNQSSAWKTDTIFFNNSVANSIRRLVISWRNDASVTNQPPIAIDDIDIRVVTCPRPTNLTVYSVTPTTAQLSWTEQGNALTWQIQYGIQGFTLGNGTIELTSNNPHTITGLTSGMNYSFYVRSICGAGDTSFWAGPFNFYVPCDAFTAPYTHNFDGITTPNLPICWTKKVIASTTAAYVQTTTTSPASPPNCAVLYNSNSQGSATHLLLITPRFSDLTTQTTRIRFKVKGNTTEKLIVGTMTDYNNENTFVPFDTINIPSSSVWTPITVSFQNYTGTGEFIAFKHATLATYTYIYIDDFIYEQLPAVELAATKVINPSIGCGLGSNENITVRIKNLGISPVSNIPVNYRINTLPVVSEMINSTIVPGDSLDYTFTTQADLSQYNLYTIKVYVSHSSDPDNSNDTTTRTVYNAPLITSYPYFEDFEQSNGNWVSGGVNNTWQWGTPAGTIFNTAASGTKAWVTNLTGNYNNNENSYVVSPCFDISSLSSAVVELKRRVHAEFSYDGAVLLVSPDDLNWIPIGNVGTGTNWYNDNTINGLAFTGTQVGWTGTTNTAWITSSHPIQNVGGYNYVKFMIAFGSDGSVNSYEGFAFDDFRIYLPMDVALVYPINNQTQHICGLTSNEQLNVWIKNVGSAQLQAGTQMQVAYRINNSTPVIETFTLPQNLSTGDSIQYIFNQTANLSNTTSYLITCWVKLVGDVTSSNDTITHTLVNYSIYVNINGGDTVCIDPLFLPYTITLQSYPYGYDTYFWSNQTGTLTGTLPFFDAPQFGWYYVTVTDGNCTATDSIFVCNILSATTQQVTSISVYPSPAPVKLFVKATSLPVDDYKVTLTTIEGKEIFSKHIRNSRTIDMEITTVHLPEGMYILSITCNDSTWKYKVVR